MAPRGRSRARRGGRSGKQPAAAPEANPQDPEGLYRLNDEWHIAGALISHIHVSRYFAFTLLYLLFMDFYGSVNLEGLGYYFSLCNAAAQGTTDIAGCVPLILSWIYHRFPEFSSQSADQITWPLAE
ncbi:hypothetical protein PIB30_092021, partial [Stylosanthes scabra]|nr:hypothetical protein [Stylosanthes scabra]